MREIYLHRLSRTFLSNFVLRVVTRLDLAGGRTGEKPCYRLFRRTTFKAVYIDRRGLLTGDYTL